MNSSHLTLAALALASLLATTPQFASAADDTEADTPKGRQRAALRLGVDAVRAELAAFSDAPEADRLASLRASPYLQWQPSRTWELRAGLRIEGSDQAGGLTPYSRWRAELGDTYLRWRSGATRVTAGAQTIVWGRVDGLAPMDRVSRVDLTRFVLDDLSEQRLALPALRWEQTFAGTKLDAVALLPGYRGAATADVASVWTLVNRSTGEIAGIEPNPAIAAFVRGARLRTEQPDSGGAALRLTRAVESAGLDLGLTLAHTRQSLPYYETDFAGGTLTAVHPYVGFVGLDAELATGGLTWRTELGWSDGVAVTAPDGRRLERRAFEWVAGVEFFPGGEDTRVTLQLSTRRLSGGGGPILQLERYTALSGEVQTTFGQGRWRAGLRFNSGLNVHDTYLSPSLAWLGWEPHEFYVAWHHFDGAPRTLGGFHRDHGTLVLGLKTRF